MQGSRARTHPDHDLTPRQRLVLQVIGTPYGTTVTRQAESAAAGWRAPGRAAMP